MSGPLFAGDRHSAAAIPLVGLLALGVGVGLPGCKDQAAFVEPPPPKVVVESPAVEQVVVYRESPGRMEAVESVEVLARVAGFIDKIAFKDGEFVDEGQLLFEIEPDR